MLPQRNPRIIAHRVIPTGRKTPPPRLPTRPQLERHCAPALPQPHLPRRQEPAQHPTAQARGGELENTLRPTCTGQGSHLLNVPELQPIPQRPHHAIPNGPVHPRARVYIRGLDGADRGRDGRVSRPLVPDGHWRLVPGRNTRVGHTKSPHGGGSGRPRLWGGRLGCWRCSNRGGDWLCMDTSDRAASGF
jgi:hypothetical protein